MVEPTNSTSAHVPVIQKKSSPQHSVSNENVPNTRILSIHKRVVNEFSIASNNRASKLRESLTQAPGNGQPPVGTNSTHQRNDSESSIESCSSFTTAKERFSLLPAPTSTQKKSRRTGLFIDPSSVQHLREIPEKGDKPVSPDAIKKKTIPIPQAVKGLMDNTFNSMEMATSDKRDPDVLFGECQKMLASLQQEFAEIKVPLAEHHEAIEAIAESIGRLMHFKIEKKARLERHLQNSFTHAHRTELQTGLWILVRNWLDRCKVAREGDAMSGEQQRRLRDMCMSCHAYPGFPVPLKNEMFKKAFEYFDLPEVHGKKLHDTELEVLANKNLPGLHTLLSTFTPDELSGVHSLLTVKKDEATIALERAKITKDGDVTKTILKTEVAPAEPGGQEKGPTIIETLKTRILEIVDLTKSLEDNQRLAVLPGLMDCVATPKLPPEILHDVFEMSKTALLKAESNPGKAHFALFEKVLEASSLIADNGRWSEQKNLIGKYAARFIDHQIDAAANDEFAIAERVESHIAQRAVSEEERAVLRKKVIGELKSEAISRASQYLFLASNFGRRPLLQEALFQSIRDVWNSLGKEEKKRRFVSIMKHDWKNLDESVKRFVIAEAFTYAAEEIKFPDALQLDLLEKLAEHHVDGCISQEDQHSTHASLREILEATINHCIAYKKDASYEDLLQTRKRIGHILDKFFLSLQDLKSDTENGTRIRRTKEYQSVKFCEKGKGLLDKICELPSPSTTPSSTNSLSLYAPVSPSSGTGKRSPTSPVAMPVAERLNLGLPHSPVVSPSRTSMAVHRASTWLATISGTDIRDKAQSILNVKQEAGKVARSNFPVELSQTVPRVMKSIRGATSILNAKANTAPQAQCQDAVKDLVVFTEELSRSLDAIGVEGFDGIQEGRYASKVFMKKTATVFEYLDMLHHEIQPAADGNMASDEATPRDVKSALGQLTEPTFAGDIERIMITLDGADRKIQRLRMQCFASQVSALFANMTSRPEKGAKNGADLWAMEEEIGNLRAALEHLWDDGFKVLTVKEISAGQFWTNKAGAEYLEMVSREIAPMIEDAWGRCQEWHKTARFAAESPAKMKKEETMDTVISDLVTISYLSEKIRIAMHDLAEVVKSGATLPAIDAQLVRAAQIHTGVKRAVSGLVENAPLLFSGPESSTDAFTLQNLMWYAEDLNNTMVRFASENMRLTILEIIERHFYPAKDKFLDELNPYLDICSKQLDVKALVLKRWDPNSDLSPSIETVRTGLTSIKGIVDSVGAEKAGAAAS